MPVTDGCKPAGNRTGTCWPGPGETEIVSTRPLLTEGEDMKRNTKKLLFALGLILPAFAMLCLTIITPLINIIWMSFHDYSLLNIKNIKWNDFKNYTVLFGEKEFWNSFVRTIVYVAVTVAAQFVLGMAVALLLNRKFPGRNLMRGLIFLPWTIPTLIVAVIWMWIMQPQYGVLNYILRSLGLITQNVNWLSSTKTAMASVIVAAVWRQLPFMMVMLLAGLQTVPQDLIEAAVIDGAGKGQVFANITLPSIMSVIKTVTLTAIIGNFQMFTLFYNMTAGGPVRASTTLTVYTYETAFMSYDLGKGAAIGVVWMIFLIGFGTLYNRRLSRTEFYG